MRQKNNKCCEESSANRRSILRRISQTAVAGSLSLLGIRQSGVAQASSSSSSAFAAERFRKYNDNNEVYEDIGGSSAQLLSKLVDIDVLNSTSVQELMKDQNIITNPDNMTGNIGETDIIASWDNESMTPKFKINKEFRHGYVILTIQPEIDHSHAIVKYENGSNSEVVAVQPTAEPTSSQNSSEDGYTAESYRGCCLETHVCAVFTLHADCADYTIHCCDSTCVEGEVNYSTGCNCSGIVDPCQNVSCPC